MLSLLRNQVPLVLGAILLLPLSLARSQRPARASGTSSALPGRPESQQPCKGNPYQVAPCFKVHGRLMYYMGAPSPRIWWIGTKRILGVSESHAEVRQMPKSLREKLKLDEAIYGDFEVCPFTKERPGEMQFVCIESASNLIVRRMR